MAKITIIQDDGVVGVDGEFRQVDLSDLDVSIHAVQYDTVAEAGEIEFDPDLPERRANQAIGKTLFEKRFNRFIKLWRAAGEPPPRTLDQVKLDARAQINGKRDTLEADGFPYMGKVFDSDPRSAQRITMAVLAAQAADAAGLPFELNWTSKDGTQITLNAQTMAAMPAALATYAAELHVEARALKESIDAASTIKAVDAIVKSATLTEAVPVAEAVAEPAEEIQS